MNINRGHNRELMEKCRRLWEYSEFIAEVNEHLDRNQSLEAAVTKAMDTCIQKGILEDFLRKNRAEVLHMLLTEYDEKKHMRGIYEVGYEEGEKAGYRKGELNLLERQIRKKLEKGKSPEVIAEELDTELPVIEEMIDKIKID